MLSKFEVEDHLMASRMELEQFILENEQYQQYILPDVLKTTLLNTDMADLFAQYSSRAVGVGKNSPEFSVKFYIQHDQLERAVALLEQMKADKFMQYCNKILLKNPAVIMP